METKLHRKFSPVYLIFVASIFIFSCSFFVQRHFMTNTDEFDHLVSAFLMKNGYTLYKDLFSHHFPLPYYWTYLFSFFWPQSPSRVITIFRLEILALYLITFVLVYLSFKNIKSKISYSLWIILISTFFTLYHGNLVLSETFLAIFIMGSFWLVMPLVLGWEKYSNYKLKILALFASASFWTQPLTLPTFILPLIFSPRVIIKNVIKFLLLINTIPILFFAFSGQLKYFYEEAIWFNFIIYPKHFIGNVPGGNGIIETFSYFVSNQIKLFTQFSTNHQLFQFILNVSVFILFGIFLKGKRTIPTLCIIIFFFLNRVREGKIVTGEPFNFGIYPYLLFGTGCFIILLTFLWKKKIFTITLLIFLTILSLHNSSKIFRQSIQKNYNYHVFWSPRQELGEKIKNLTDKDDPILIYPYDIGLYYFANRFPNDRFIFWFPWIDAVEKYRQEKLAALKNNPPALIYIDNLDFRNEKDYYKRIFPTLTDGYTKISESCDEKGIWLRNDLFKK